MARPRVRVRCSACDHTAPRWVGRCEQCGRWGTMAEERVTPDVPPRSPPAARVAAHPLARVAPDATDRRSTGQDEFDRVLGGGLVPGSVVLLGGEPGAGKSTLLLQAAHRLAVGGAMVLYVSGEESPGQVRLRADRLAALDDRVLLACTAELSAIEQLLDEHAPDVLIVDSIQTVRHPDTSGAAGGSAQVRACGDTLTSWAKARGIATVLIGHVTKEGGLAGPRSLEHRVDTVCEFDGDRHHALRLLRAVKNRYGAVGEVGCFRMTGTGLEGVADAGRLFVGEAPDGTTGLTVTLACEGSRPLACELQALVVASTLTNPRRVASGLDSRRLNLLVAVLQQRAGLALGQRDVYASTVGGLRLAEPAMDLALCLAIASADTDRPVPRDLVVIGEVGLAGETRLVAQTERRLDEAARLGFRRALVPAAYDRPGHPRLRLLRAAGLDEALRLGMAAAPAPARAAS